jgi:hypothetical protein
MTQKSLTIGIATRGRAALAAQVAEHTLRNCRADTRIVVLADHDDDLGAMVLPREVILDVQPRPDSVGAKWNRMMTVAPAQVYMAMVDYRAQITPGFDQNILNAAALFPDGIGAVYQHMANAQFPAYQCVTARMADIMGHFYVEYFPYWFVDHWLDDIAKMTGRFAYAEGDTHAYPRPGNGGTQDLREPALWATLYDALYLEREAIAERLLTAMHVTESQRSILRAQWPLVHQKSRIINEPVRGMAGNAPHDERYAKIRAKGISLLETLYYDMEKRAA